MSIPSDGIDPPESLPAPGRRLEAAGHWESAVRVVTTAAELDALSPEWQVLAARAGPLQRIEWVQAWVATLLPRDAHGLRLTCIRRNGRLVALAPLVPRYYAGWRRLEQAGVREISEPQDLLYADDAALTALLTELLRQSEPLAFERLPESSHVPTLLRAVAGRRRWVQVSTHAPYPSLDLRIDSDQALNAGRRSDLRRALRRAGRHGEPRFELLAPIEREVDALYESVMAVEAASWKGRAGTALRQDARLGTFFHDYARRAARAGILRIARLHLGTSVAAAQYAVECGDAWWLFKIGYDARFADCSPGQLLMQHTLRVARERGLARYELQGVAADWTRLWPCTEHASIAVRAYRWGPAALAAAATLGAELLRRRLGNS